MPELRRTGRVGVALLLPLRWSPQSRSDDPRLFGRPRRPRRHRPPCRRRFRRLPGRPARPPRGGDGRVSPVLLQGAGIEKRFGRVTAIRGLDFEIRPGESVAILGANGAGKSTLLRILAGLSRPSSGVFEAHAFDAPAPDSGGRHASGRRLSRDALRGEIGYVGHATLLYGELTARENLVFAAGLHGRVPERRRIDAILADARLADVADLRVGTFSRGMAQRLAIARAIVHEPPVLLLDEPFTGLDETSADRLSNQLVRLRADGRTLILITHHPNRAVELADRALVLHRGEIRATPGGPARSDREADGDGCDPEFTAEGLRELLARLAAEGSSPNGDAPEDPGDGGPGGAACRRATGEVTTEGDAP
ncbi:MAG TPA: ABC transporter ATP-binding protein [Deltaproteobacteria bacterium]|nr:ABC transporter ATP-binding protein [Deltaproteobacteria bacterium]